MLQLTPDAERYLVRLRRARGADDRAGARLVSKGGRVGLTFAPAPLPGHEVVNGEGIDVYIPSAIADVLDESIVDVRHEQGRARLVIRKRAAIG